MEEVTAADRDIDSIPPRDSIDAHDASDSTQNGDSIEIDSATVIKDEDQLAPVNGDDGGVIERPTKRRKLEDATPRRSASRAVSPPWKSFVADGPTTVFENGVRKSSRVNKDTAPPTPEPVKRNSRPASKTTQTNGTPKNGVKRESRNGSGPMSVPKGKTPSTITKKASAQSLVTPARKSERQRKPSGLATALQNGSPEGTRKRVGRSRRGAQAPTDDLGDEPVDDAETNGHDPYAGLYGSPDDSNPAMPAPRLRLRLRKPDPPNRHPAHAPPKSEYASLEEWLGQDDPLDGEEALRTTQEKAEEEAERRLQIVEAAEHGVLSQTRCSVYAPEAAPEPPPQYGHWDHVVAHALHFGKLLKEEKVAHRRTAKILAREAYDFWKNKFKRKSQDEIEQEETERQVTRYKQLVKDVKDAWGLVKVEIDKERVAKYEEEQLQLGHKAMDDMFNQAQEILGGRNAGDGASSLVSEDRDFDEMESESGVSHASEQQHDDDIMSSSSDSEQENEQDEDANLTAEQLREKYGQLPDIPESSSEAEANSEDDDDEQADAEEGTPAPTPDPDLEDEDTSEPPENTFQHTNGFNDNEEDEEKKKPGYIDPATIELDQVDDALLDSEDDKGSESGSEAWSSNEGSGSDDDGEEAGESEDDDDQESEEEELGMMGFLAPKDIKKLKEAAKTTIDDMKSEESSPQIEQPNGHAPSPAETTEEKPRVNGHDSVAEVDEPHVNGDTAAQPAPSIEIAESTPMEDVVRSKSASRSRHTSSTPRTEVPFLLRGTLREYQHDGLDWLANLYESDTNGILADEMGLGKTIQTISLLAYLAVRREIWGPHLVVVPTSVMLNWEMEFKKFLPGFKILTYYGDINERKRKRSGWRNTGKDMYNVVITSYQLILQDAAAFKMRPWRYLVLDEAHNIKNFKSQRWQTMLNLRTERRLLLTGTPLQNNIDELWSLLYFLMPAGFAGEGRMSTVSFLSGNDSFMTDSWAVLRPRRSCPPETTCRLSIA